MNYLTILCAFILSPGYLYMTETRFLIYIVRDTIPSLIQIQLLSLISITLHKLDRRRLNTWPVVYNNKSGTLESEAICRLFGRSPYLVQPNAPAPRALGTINLYDDESIYYSRYRASRCKIHLPQRRWRDLVGAKRHIAAAGETGTRCTCLDFRIVE